MKDRQITKILRFLTFAFLIGSAFYLVPDPSRKKFIHIFLGCLGLAGLTTACRYYIYNKIYSNFKKIAKQRYALIKKGNFLFGVPHSIEFAYLGKNYRVEHSVNSMLDYMIEYVAPVNQEVELRISQRNKQVMTGGEDRYLMNFISKEPHQAKIVEDLLADFNNLYIGKDGFARFIKRYESYLTSPEKVFLTLDKIAAFIGFLENKVLEKRAYKRTNETMASLSTS